jgi:hypothetical protein
MSAFAREELLGQEGCQVALAAFLFKSFGLLKPQPSRWLESGKRSQSGSLRPPRWPFRHENPFTCGRGRPMGYLVEECISVMKIEGLPVIDDPDDYSFVVKRRGNPPKPWRWEIYRACCSAPIERSSVFFESMAEAAKDGKKALARLLAERAA